MDPAYLNPTRIIDSDHHSLATLAAGAVEAVGDKPVSLAIHLYYQVRDGIWYDPYAPFYRPEHYRASNVLAAGRGFCIGKASLLCALGRACRIPSRVGFATVRNHLTSQRLKTIMGSDRFVWHGFVEFYLEGRWVKATPAFNAALCVRLQVPPLEFDGRTDSLFQTSNSKKARFMVYEADHGTFADIPVKAILNDWKAIYGTDRVQSWIDDHESSRDTPRTSDPVFKQ